MNYTTLTAIICIGLLEGIALFNGINGTMFSLSIGAIAGLGGYSIARIKNNQDLK